MIFDMGRRLLLPVAALVALTVLPIRAAPPASDRDDLSVKSVVAAASKYVARYEQEFAFLLAEEAYSQVRMRGTTTLESRRLKSEFFLTFLPADDEWVAVRDNVARVVMSNSIACIERVINDYGPTAGTNRIVDLYALDDAALVVDVPGLGRQVLHAGRKPLGNDEHGLLRSPPGLYLEPPLHDPALDDLMVTVGALGLRFDTRAAGP